MADFVQTMKDWRRMCDACPIEKGGACGCHPAGHYAACSMKEIGKEADLACGNLYFERLEKAITVWAAEHPVVYPTWREWLSEQGILFAGGLWEKAFDPIPADIAEKLGIKPKEDV